MGFRTKATHLNQVSRYWRDSTSTSGQAGRDRSLSTILTQHSLKNRN